MHVTITNISQSLPPPWQKNSYAMKKLCQCLSTCVQAIAALNQAHTRMVQTFYGRPAQQMRPPCVYSRCGHSVLGFASLWLRYCTDVAQRRSTKLYMPSHGLAHYIHFRGLLLPNRILPGAKLTLRPSLVFSYIGSVTGRSSVARAVEFRYYTDCYRSLAAAGRQ